MTTLTATAVITAVDRASAVFARVGANASALGGRFSGAIGGLTRFGQAAAMNLGLPAAIVGGMAARGEYELDKLTRVMQAAGELTDQQRKMLTDKAFDVSAATGEAVTDIVKGQRELILGGLDADTTAMTSDIIAKVARANEVAAGQVAEDAITNASALGLAMGTTEEKVRSLTKALDFMSVVPAFSPMNWEDLSTSMKYAGPVVGALKVQMADLGTALSMLAFAGFKGEEAGTALRTILTRLVAPTRKARMELRAAGIDQTKLFSIDKDKANNKGALLDSLVQQGLMTTKERARAERVLQKVAFDGQNAAAYTDRLNAILGKVLGIKRGDTQDREILKATIDNHLLRAIGDLDIERVFTSIKDLPLKSLKELFGLQRISQARKLADQIGQIVEMPNGERISAWQKLRGEIDRAIEGASERKAGSVLTGYSATLDRVRAAFDSIRHKIFESGFGADISSVFERLSGSVNRLSQTDPEQLKRIGFAITALMTAPLVGGGVAGIAALALAFTNLSDIFKGGMANVLGPNGGILSKSIDSPAMEAFGGLQEFASETLGLFGDIAGKVGGAVSAIAGLMGMNLEGSLLGTSLKAIKAMFETLAGIVRELRSLLKGGDSKSGDLPMGDFYGIKPDPEAYERQRERFLNWWNGSSAAPTAPGPMGSALRYGDPTASSTTMPSIRQQFPDAGMQRVDVTGKADLNVRGQADVNVKSDVRVEVIGGGRVVDQSTGGAAVSVKLDPGHSEMDLQGP